MIVGCIIQARMSSQRLPGKVAADIWGKPMLQRVVERVSMSKRVNTIIVATSTNKDDDAVELLVEKMQHSSVHIFRGSLDDVLDRFYQAAKQFKLDAIVRITADCPLIDWVIIDQLVELFKQGSYDYISNVFGERTFPRGLDVELLSFSVLERMWRECILIREREHVTTAIREHPERYVIKSFFNSRNLSHYRWTVDVSEDLQFVREVYAQLDNGGNNFVTSDIVALLERQPHIAAINHSVEQKKNIDGDTN